MDATESKRGKKSKTKLRCGFTGKMRKQITSISPMRWFYNSKWAKGWEEKGGGKGSPWGRLRVINNFANRKVGRKARRSKISDAHTATLRKPRATSEAQQSEIEDYTKKWTKQSRSSDRS